MGSPLKKSSWCCSSLKGAAGSGLRSRGCLSEDVTLSWDWKAEEMEVEVGKSILGKGNSRRNGPTVGGSLLPPRNGRKPVCLEHGAWGVPRAEEDLTDQQEDCNLYFKNSRKPLKV